MLWTIGQFPELDHLDPAQRKELLRRVPWWMYPQMAILAAVGAAGIAGAAAAVTYGVAGSERAAVAVFVVAEGASAVALYQVVLQRVRRAMRAEIAEGFSGRRPPFCFGCGYDLRAFTDDCCPECGRMVVPECHSASNRKG